MADGRKNNGGARKGAGRKPKASEQELIERLDKVIDKDDVIKVLKKMALNGNYNAVKLYLEYRFGKPKETVHNINQNFNQELTQEEAKELNDFLNNEY